MQLDHLFVMVPDPEALVGPVQGLGLSVRPPRVHPGQGSRNRNVPLAGCFLELLSVPAVDEARGNALRLDRRAAWRETGASPLGVALRGPAPGAGWWRYHPPYPTPGFSLWVRALPDTLPLVFLLAWEPLSAAPAYEGPAVRALRVEGPGCGALDGLPAPVVAVEAPRPRLEVQVEGVVGALEVDEVLRIAG